MDLNRLLAITEIDHLKYCTIYEVNTGGSLLVFWVGNGINPSRPIVIDIKEMTLCFDLVLHDNGFMINIDGDVINVLRTLKKELGPSIVPDCIKDQYDSNFNEMQKIIKLLEENMSKMSI